MREVLATRGRGWFSAVYGLWGVYVTRTSSIWTVDVYVMDDDAILIARGWGADGLKVRRWARERAREYFREGEWILTSSVRHGIL